MFKKLLFEFAGSVVLIFTGCLTAITLQASYMNANAFFMTSIVFGGVYALLYAGFGEISGCHLNPVISVVQFLDGKLKLPGVIVYTLVQLLGGACAGLLIWYMATDKVAIVEYGCTTFYDGDFIKTLILELIAGFVVAGAYLVSQREKARFGHIPGALINGVAYAAMYCFTFPADHGGVNVLKPFATTIGGLLTGQELTSILFPLAVVLIGSFCGGMFAWFFCSNLKPAVRKQPEEEQKAPELISPSAPEKRKEKEPVPEEQPVQKPRKKKKRVTEEIPVQKPQRVEEDDHDFEPVKTPKQRRKRTIEDDEDDFFSGDF